MLDKRKFYINGAWVEPVEAHDLKVIDPSTEEACAVISNGTSKTSIAPLQLRKQPLRDGSIPTRKNV